MSTGGLPAQARLSRGVSKAPVVPFPAGDQQPAQLRKLRDQFFREGRLDLAVQVAEQVAEREPGRASLYRLGFLYRESARYREALKTFRDALRFAEGPAYLIPEIHLHLAHTWFLMGQRKRMKESLRRAYASRWKPRSSPKFHMALGTEYFERRRYREAAQEYARAEAAASEPLDRGRNAVNQAIAHYRLGRLEEAEKHLSRALRLHGRHAHQLELAGVRSIRAAVCFELGHFKRGLGIVERAAATFRRFGKQDRQAEALMNAGYFAGELGDWERSRRLLDQALEAAGQGQGSVVAAAHACRATASAAQGRFEQAQKDIARARDELRGRRDWFGTTHLCRAEGRIARMLGSWKDVRRAARLGERQAAKAGDLYRVMEFRKMRAEAERELGRTKAYESAVRGVGRISSLVDVPSPDRGEALETVPRLAATRVPLLLVGEADAGALELARAIHRLSPRSKEPCIVVECEQMVFPASDLGGHAEGAWSGASKAAPGWVQQADRGTLILDRVDELEAADQRVLLRVVDGHVRAVGEAQEHPIDVRVIATCQNPARLLPELRHRLSGAAIEVASLRARPDEIRRIAQEHLAGRRTLSPDAMAELLRLPWTGNLSELRAVLDRLAAHSTDVIGRKLVLRLTKTPKRCRVAGPVDGLRQPALAARSER